jgi:monovalent cation/hydrogen antiporter
VARASRPARAETARAALAAVHDTESKAELTPLLRHKYENRLQRAETGTSEDYTALHRKAQAAERRILSDLRTNGVIGDDAFHRVEEELDWAELNIDGMAREN